MSDEKKPNLMSKDKLAVFDMTSEQLKVKVAAMHAERFLSGCAGYCEACVARLGIELVTCPICRNARVPLEPVGTLVHHDRMVGARPGYRARAQLCDGSGMKTKGGK